MNSRIPDEQICRWPITSAGCHVAVTYTTLMIAEKVFISALLGTTTYSFPKACSRSPEMSMDLDLDFFGQDLGFFAGFGSDLDLRSSQVSDLDLDLEIFSTTLLIC